MFESSVVIRDDDDDDDDDDKTGEKGCLKVPRL
jgi:hypothetical protein